MKYSFKLDDNEVTDLIRMPFNHFSLWLKEAYRSQDADDRLSSLKELKVLDEALEKHNSRQGTELYRMITEKRTLISRFYCEAYSAEEERLELLKALSTTQPMFLNESEASQ